MELLTAIEQALDLASPPNRVAFGLAFALWFWRKLNQSLATPTLCVPGRAWTRQQRSTQRQSFTRLQTSLCHLGGFEQDRRSVWRERQHSSVGACGRVEITPLRLQARHR